MALYSLDERLKLYNCFIKNNKSPALALREYSREYPNNRVPSRTLFFRIVRDLENGVLKNSKKNRPNFVLTEEKQLEILLYFEEDAERSQRDADRDIAGVSRGSIQKTLQVNGYHPYKFLPTQLLSQLDFNERLTFCCDIMDRQFENVLFSKVLWTDEASFNTAGIFNRKNTHYWSKTNKHLIKAIKKQGRQTVNVWCGIICDRIIGPIFFDRSLNGERYLELLRNEIMPLINDLPANIRENIIFQQDSAPYHTVAPVVNFLNQHFPLWIGRHGLISWPPRSPDLSPLDFFLWGALKNKVYKNRSNNRNELKIKIREEINNFNASNSVRNAIRKMEAIYTSCIAMDGGHIENFL